MSKLSLIFLSLLLCSSLPAQAEESSLIARMQNVEPSLVEIKTVYAKTLRTKNGHMALASY